MIRRTGDVEVSDRAASNLCRLGQCRHAADDPALLGLARALACITRHPLPDFDFDRRQMPRLRNEDRNSSVVGIGLARRCRGQSAGSRRIVVHSLDKHYQFRQSSFA